MAAAQPAPDGPEAAAAVATVEELLGRIQTLEARLQSVEAQTGGLEGRLDGVENKLNVSLGEYTEL